MKLDDVLFFFMRHPETPGNKKGIYRSWSNAPDAQLTEPGKKAAADAGRYLLSIGAPIELIVADSLDRVQEGVEILARDFPEARIEFVRSLHPLNMGDFTLKPKAEHPVGPYLEDTSKQIPGGEKVDEFNDRQDQVFKTIFSLAKDLRGGKILVAGHGSNSAYLHNHVFGAGDPQVGYEGLVDPGGLIAVTPKGMVPLTKIRKGEKKDTTEPKVSYPADHQVGMKVPKGGSMCANCEYHEPEGNTCKNEFFIRWNGSNQIPEPADEYCSDYWEPK